MTCDHAFLDREFARIGVLLPPVPLLCTMRLARAHLPQARGYGLVACAEAAGLGGFPAHTALGDARATAELLRHCVGAPSCPPDDWVVPLREAARVPWPRLGRPRSGPAGELVPWLRREPLAEPPAELLAGPPGPSGGPPGEPPPPLPYGLRTPGAQPPAVVPKQSGAMGSRA